MKETGTRGIICVMVIGLVIGGVIGYLVSPREVGKGDVVVSTLWRQCEGEGINVTMQDHPSTALILDHLPEFEEMTGITVEVDVLPWGTLIEKDFTDLSTGTGFYDVVNHPAKYTLAQYTKNDWIESLNDYLEDPTLTEYGYDYLDFFEPMRLLMEEPVWGEKGAIYGVPDYGETSICYYRTDIFEDKGLSEEDLETMEGVEEAAAICHNPPEVYGALMRGLREHAGCYMVGFFHMYGAEYVDKNWEPAFCTPEGIEALTHYTSILINCGPPGVTGYGFPEVHDTFRMGKIAILPVEASVWAGSFSASDSPVAGKYDVTFVPKGSVRSAPDLHAMALSINKDSAHKNAAWLFIQWATSKRIERITTLEGRSDACRASTWNDPQVVEYWESVGLGKLRQVVFESFKMAKFPEPENPACQTFEPKFPEYLETREYIGEAIGAVIMGDKTPEEALDALAVHIRRILGEAGYYE